MKKHFLTTCTILMLTSITMNGDELSWVDQQIEAIKPPRKGISNYDISKMSTPFVFLYKDKLTKSKDAKKKPKKRYTKKIKTSNSKKALSTTTYAKLRLSAIINGSALINGKWYKLNEKVYGYTLSGIKTTSVLLTSGKRRLILSTSDTKRNLKFK